jgi:hypothetical protein
VTGDTLLIKVDALSFARIRFLPSKMQNLPMAESLATNMDCSSEFENDKYPYSASQPFGGMRKSVSFSRDVRVYKVMHINNYTEEEIAATWNGASEIAGIKEKILATLSFLNSGNINSNNYVECCSRGLENLTDEGFKNRRRRREIAINAVLEKQDLRYEDNEIDDHLIAAIYSQHTRLSKTIARVVGLADEKGIFVEDLEIYERRSRPCL